MKTMPARKCKECGGFATFVCDSRQRNGDVKRRVQCKNCGRRWTTYEVTEKDFTALKEAKKNARNKRFGKQDGV